MPDAIEPSIDELRRRARRRLVGAIVLALGAAVLVPMLLESEPKPLGEDVSVRIPPVDEGKFVSKIEKNRAVEPASSAAKSSPAASASDALTASEAKQAPAAPALRKLPEPPTAPAKAKEVSAPATKEELSGEAAPTPPSPPVVATPVKAAAEPAAASAEPAKSSKPGSGFSVQLAAFADDKGANALTNRLKKAGHPAYTEAYETSKGTLWRVRVGPYATRDAAEAARAKLKADGQTGIITVSS